MKTIAKDGNSNHKEGLFHMKTVLITAAIVTMVSFTAAQACPSGTHPVCSYDGSGKSHCVCVR
jgi:hypothetical protein